MFVTVFFIQRPHRHHEAGGAEAALRAVAFDHCFLYRMQRAVGLTQIFDGEQRFSVESRKKLDARVDGLEADCASVVAFAQDDRTGATVAFGAAFLGAGAERVFAQVLEDRASDGRVADFADRVAVVETDGLAHVSVLVSGCAAAFARRSKQCGCGSSKRITANIYNP
jgi:hypothetical protein